MLRTHFCVVFSLFLLGNIVLADETKVTAKTEAVALFKNGYTVVRQEIDVPGSGIYRWEEVPPVIHGTFFIESDMTSTCKRRSGLFPYPSMPKIRRDWQPGNSLPWISQHRRIIET